MQFEIHSSPEDNIKVDFNLFFYNTPGFLKTNCELQVEHYYLLDHSTKSYQAHIAFSLSEENALSHFKAPFGGLEVSDLISDEGLDYFTKQVLHRLREKNIYELRIHQPPENYQSNSHINSVFQFNGLELSQERVYHDVTIEQGSIKDKIAEMQQRRLRKCEKVGFEFKHFSETELESVFKQIDRWRTLAQKGLSMTWADLQKTSKENPKRYHSFGVMDGDLLIAASIVILVNEKVLYHFFPASNDVYNKYSPMVMLISGIYEWGRENGFKHIDLGTSYIDGSINTSLRTFKERMGGEPYIAKSWRKRLN